MSSCSSVFLNGKMVADGQWIVNDFPTRLKTAERRYSQWTHLQDMLREVTWRGRNTVAALCPRHSGGICSNWVLLYPKLRWRLCWRN